MLGLSNGAITAASRSPWSDLQVDAHVNFEQGELAMFRLRQLDAHPGRRAVLGRLRADPDVRVRPGRRHPGDDPAAACSTRRCWWWNRLHRPAHLLNRMATGSSAPPSSRPQPVRADAWYGNGLLLAAPGRHDDGDPRHHRRGVCFFRYTRLGLAMRAAAINPIHRLVGGGSTSCSRLGWASTPYGRGGGMMAAPMFYLAAPTDERHPGLRAGRRAGRHRKPVGRADRRSSSSVWGEPAGCTWSDPDKAVGAG